MLASVKLGLSSMDTGNGVFFLPGDVPLTEPETFRKLWNMREERAGKVSALIPMNGEKQIHPPIFLRRAVPESWVTKGILG